MLHLRVPPCDLCNERAGTVSPGYICVRQSPFSLGGGASQAGRPRTLRAKFCDVCQKKAAATHRLRRSLLAATLAWLAAPVLIGVTIWVGMLVYQVFIAPQLALVPGDSTTADAVENPAAGENTVGDSRLLPVAGTVYVLGALAAAAMVPGALTSVTRRRTKELLGADLDEHVRNATGVKAWDWAHELVLTRQPPKNEPVRALWATTPVPAPTSRATADAGATKVAV